MIQKVTITKVFKNENKKDGTPYTISKGQHAGKTFTRIGIQTDKTGEETYYNNALATDKAMNIEVGQSLLLNLTEDKKEDGSGSWYNFNFPTKDQLAEFTKAIA